MVCDFKIKYILNVTPKCPNHFEKESLVYKRIAVADTGSQKLSVHFFDAFKFIGTYVNGFVIDYSPNIRTKYLQAFHGAIQS